ncbi:MAG: hypothetical protein ACREFE_13915 [Limisphaerales bacterium]
MKWLPKERRNPFILAVIVTTAALAGIYLALIQPQYRSLSKAAADQLTAEKKLNEIEKAIKNKDIAMRQLAEASNALSSAERDMASGDLYSWTYQTMRLFDRHYAVEIPEIGHPVVGDVDLFSSFPYKQLRFTVNGTAYFHDLGRFIAGFENAFPHARVINVVMAPDNNGEKLTFTMEIIALVKPNVS